MPAAAVVLAALTGMFPALASEPPSHDVTAPSNSGAKVRVEWTGAMPPGANTGNTCVGSVAADEHAINLTVPDGLYATGLSVRATFAISWSGPTDGIITVMDPSGSAVSGDNGFVDADEFVKLVNPKPGTYRVLACAFAGAVPQTYSGSLELIAKLPFVCPTDSVDGIDLQSARIPDIGAALASGVTTSRALVEAYLGRIALFDRVAGLNSIRGLSPNALEQADALDAERRRGAVRGPLHGIPIVLKDNVGTTDMPTTAGSIALAGSIPLHEAFLTQRLRAAGAIILGKTNLSEFANWVDLDMPSGYSSLGGQVVNAFHFGDPSGSSSGSGVAASMALATATIGTETSGSILSPSIANGVVGIKPTVGLVSRAGVIPLAATFDTPGPIARSVTDAAIVLGVIAGADPRDAKTSSSDGKIPHGSDYRPFLRADGLKGKRIGVSDADGTGLGAGAKALWDEVLATVDQLGATIVHSDNLARIRNAGLLELAVIPNEFKAGLNDYLAKETVPNLRVRTLSDIIAYNAQHPDKMKYGQRLLQASDLTLGNTDEPTAVASRTATSTLAQTAIDVAMTADNLDAILAPGPVNANIGAAALYPTIAVPAGAFSDTQPFGVTFLGRAYSEPSLISFAYAYEQASHRRVLPTKVNHGLCLQPTKAKVKPVTRVKGARDTRGGALPATGVESSPAGAALIILALGLGLALKRRAVRA
jgi:amidase